MKATRISGNSLMLLIFVMAAPFSGIASDDEGRLPPDVQIYKGGNAVERDSGEVYVIYTKDKPDKVMDFYRNSLGIEPIQGRKFYLGDEDTGEYAGIVPVYVTVETATERTDGLISEERLFGSLQDELERAEAMRAQNHSKRDFQQLKKTYSHLTWGWYPDFDVNAKVKSCEEKNQPDSEAFADQSDMDAARIQALVAQGRFDEATAMVDKSAQGGMDVQNESTRVHWDEWVSCFREIDRHDYQVRVLIPRIVGRFTPATASGRANAMKQLKEQESGHENKEKESSNGTNELMEKGMDGLKGMFGF